MSDDLTEDELRVAVMRADLKLKTKQGTFISLIDQRFGRLTVVAFVRPYKHGRATGHIWRCWCDCGGEVEAHGSNLRTGNTQSCGCLRRERQPTQGTAGHDKTGKRSATYQSWSHMMSRCLDPASDRYPYYGGRGITVCDRWTDFANFLADMGERPRDTTIERLDNSKGYEPGNCVWAPMAVQSNNTRANVMVAIDGQSMSLAEAARARGVSGKTVASRRRAGWPTDRLFEPARPINRG